VTCLSKIILIAFIVPVISFLYQFVNFIIEDKQDFIEDCYICCRPNRIVILTAKDEGGPFAEARLTDE